MNRDIDREGIRAELRKRNITDIGPDYFLDDDDGMYFDDFIDALDKWYREAGDNEYSQSRDR